MLHFYCIGPIDTWFGALKADDLLMELSSWGDLRSIAGWASDLSELESQARVAFKGLGWEGDISNGPFYFAIPLPDDNSMGFGIVWKQSNNGTCFVASPVELPHLDEE